MRRSRSHYNPTAYECHAKAIFLRRIADDLLPGSSRERVLEIAARWQKRARQLSPDLEPNAVLAPSRGPA
jgi:hypothetical protein